MKSKTILTICLLGMFAPCSHAHYITLRGSRYLIVSDMTCGKNVRTGDEGNVTFEQGSTTEIEKSGKLVLGPGTVIKAGATLRVKQSNINF